MISIHRANLITPMTVSFATLSITATHANLERLTQSVRRLETLFIAGEIGYWQFYNLQGLMFRVMDVINPLR